MTYLDRQAFRVSFAVFALFLGVAGDFWRDLLTWYGWGVMVALAIVGAVLLLVHDRTRFRLGKLPLPLIGFLGLATLSIAWSDYRLESVLGVVSQFATTAVAMAVAVTLTWDQLLRALGLVFRLVLALSILFELVVSIFIRHPIFPVWVVPDDPAHPAQLLYWSRDLLLHLGKIQGIVGNSSLLAMAALIGLIVFVVQLLARSVSRIAGSLWIALAVGTIAITRSATIFLALAVVVIIAVAVVIVRSARTPRALGVRYGVIAVIVLAGAVSAVVLRTPLLHALGKSADFTGRIGIWNAVIALAEQRPAIGWGWVSYWTPWVAPFDHLIVRGGVQVLHAHNAWLDVWLQLGIVGLVVFGALVLSVSVRSWLFAVDRVITGPTPPGRYSWITLLPLLVFAAQLVQSLAESRMLVEGGWMLLVIWAIRTKWYPSIVDLTAGGKPTRERMAA